MSSVLFQGGSYNRQNQARGDIRRLEARVAELEKKLVEALANGGGGGGASGNKGVGLMGPQGPPRPPGLSGTSRTPWTSRLSGTTGPSGTGLYLLVPFRYLNFLSDAALI